MKNLLTSILSSLLLSLPAQAQLILGFTGGDDLSVGPGTAGYQFTVGSAGQTISTLGVWASDPSGQLWNSHTVGIWDATSHSLLASAVIPATGAVSIGAFWYVNITPLALQGSHSFVIGASYLDSDFDFAKGNVTGVTLGPGITLGDPLLSSGTGFGFPDLDVSGASLGFIGPNAGFAPVPEPASTAVACSLALVGFVVYRHSKRVTQRGLAIADLPVVP